MRQAGNQLGFAGQLVFAKQVCAVLDKLGATGRTNFWFFNRLTVLVRIT